MKQSFLLVVSGCILAFALSACDEKRPLPPKNVDSLVECPDDFKSCEDGITVRRDPLNSCEFSRCPEPNNNPCQNNSDCE